MIRLLLFQFVHVAAFVSKILIDVFKVNNLIIFVNTRKKEKGDYQNERFTD